MPVRSTGITELRRANQQLPQAVQDALRGVAHDTAGRIRDRAKGTVAFSDVTGLTRKSIRVTDARPEDKAIAVEAGDVNHPGGAAVADHLEFGTRHQAARPFMRPAADAESERYVRESAAAAESVAREELT